jgi:hypothetical protein
VAATGRETPHDRDKPKIKDVITQTGNPADAPEPIANAITCPHPMGQVAGQNEPAIANTITKAGPNK